MGMTNEEAREVINREIDKAIDDETYMTDEIYDALCVASKSIALQILESEPQPCEDAISRQAVLDLATTIETDDYSGNEILEVVEVEAIKNLPSVTPQPFINMPCISEGVCHEDKVNLLKKIKAEIMQLDYDLESVDYDYDDMAQTEEVHMICREEVFHIIDEYIEKGEKDETDN